MMQPPSRALPCVSLASTSGGTSRVVEGGARVRATAPSGCACVCVKPMAPAGPAVWPVPLPKVLRWLLLRDVETLVSSLVDLFPAWCRVHVWALVGARGAGSVCVLT